MVVHTWADGFGTWHARVPEKDADGPDAASVVAWFAILTELEERGTVDPAALYVVAVEPGHYREGKRNPSTILESYLECALWSSVHHADEDDPGTPMDDLVDLDDVSDELRAQSLADILAMVESAEHLDGAEAWDDGQFGHDFWLTRNGHGTGFWDRYYGENDPRAIAGDVLTQWADGYGEVDLYIGDDGKVYS